MLLAVTHSPPEESSFEALLQRARSGDEDARNELYGSFYPRVRHLVHQSLDRDMRRSRPWLKARFSTGDVVQEVFRSVIADIDAFGGTTERAFAGYLGMVVRNRIIDAIRFHEADQRDGRRPSTPLMEEFHSSNESGPSDQAASAEEIERLYSCLATFPAREQLLLRARFEGTASYAELAERLGYGSISAVRRAYFAVQAELALKIDEESAEGGSA